MQATVRTFDPATRAGTVLADDGVELSYDADALAGTGLRHLRLGQRVQVEVDGSGPATRVRSLRIYTLPE
jgi:cold shock CspA family protein